jgi:hypothetical protein
VFAKEAVRRVMILVEPLPVVLQSLHCLPVATILNASPSPLTEETVERVEKPAHWMKTVVEGVASISAQTIPTAANAESIVPPGSVVLKVSAAKSAPPGARTAINAPTLIPTATTAENAEIPVPPDAPASMESVVVHSHSPNVPTPV